MDNLLSKRSFDNTILSQFWTYSHNADLYEEVLEKLFLSRPRFYAYPDFLKQNPE